VVQCGRARSKGEGNGELPRGERTIARFYLFQIFISVGTRHHSGMDGLTGPVAVNDICMGANAGHAG
jgi:hypothetical protein